MSGASRVRSMNGADSEIRPVLGHAGNNAQKAVSTRRSGAKSARLAKKLPEQDVMAEEKSSISSSSVLVTPCPPSRSISSTILGRHESILRSNLSLSASCSSDASSDSFHSRASTGRIYRCNGTVSRRRQLSSKPKHVVPDDVSECSPDGLQSKKRCAWITPTTDQSYVDFHDEEWGVPVHDDKKLFELLVLSGALAELTWPAILNKRHIFREVFMDFDPIAVAKLNERKLVAPGNLASSLLSEFKLRTVVENAHQISKVIDEFGSFSKYIWSFVNKKPIVSKFRYPRQVPVKTPKADLISKDLVRRGFRSVGPTIVYSFMQAAGITNDHIISCFRFHECSTAGEVKERETINGKVDEIKADEEAIETDICKAAKELSFSSE